MRGRKWTKEELDYLQDRWGVVSKQAIANKLGRSFNAVNCKAYRIGLEDALYHLDGITISALADTIGVEYQIVSNWANIYGLPIKTKVTSKTQAYKFINLKDWWKWAEKKQAYD